MELLAVFIKNHFLFKKPEFLNFGGLYLFDFQLKKNGLYISKKENQKFLNEFYGKSILNISAIVGNNGVGKTSLLRVINQEPGHDLVSIYINNDNEIIIRNQSNLKLKLQFDYLDYSDDNQLCPMYYSNHIDYNSKLTNSPINQSNLFQDSLEDYFYGSILRQLFFLNGKGQILKNTFKELPYYEFLTIKVNNIEKSKYFDNIFYQKSDTGQSIKTELDMLWNYYTISNEESIHANYNFIANFEVFVLTLLVSDDTFAQTNSNGKSISFQDVLNQSSFEDKLEVFLKKRIDNIDGPLFQSLENSIGVILLNSEELIKAIETYKISKIAGGFDFNQMKRHAINTIKRYLAVLKLYQFISNNSDKTFIFQKPNEIKIFVNQDSSQNFLETFIRLYQDVQESIDYMQFDYRIFNIAPGKKLSTGELSLLNFYSAIYAFVRKGQDHLRKHNQYLLLLDEPETGYHAVWKKKFIKSITEILPELFKGLEQNPKIQILFTTHDALTLSDIPNDNITYLKRLEESIMVFKIKDDERPKRSFAANITDLLADSFFVENGLVGDFAKSRIQEVMDNLNYLILGNEIEVLKTRKRENEKDLLTSKIDEKNKLESGLKNLQEEDIRSIIDIIDEPILKFKLDEMYYQAFPQKIDREDAITRAKQILGNAGLSLSDLNEGESS